MSLFEFKLTLEFHHICTYNKEEWVEKKYQEYLQEEQKKSGEKIPASSKSI